MGTSHKAECFYLASSFFSLHLPLTIMSLCGCLLRLFPKSSSSDSKRVNEHIPLPVMSSESVQTHPDQGRQPVPTTKIDNTQDPRDYQGALSQGILRCERSAHALILDLKEAIARVASTGWTGFKALLNVLHKVSGAFPPLDATVGGLVALIDVYDVRIWLT